MTTAVKTPAIFFCWGLYVCGILTYGKHKEMEDFSGKTIK